MKKTKILTIVMIFLLLIFTTSAILKDKELTDEEIKELKLKEEKELKDKEDGVIKVEKRLDEFGKKIKKDKNDKYPSIFLYNADGSCFEHDGRHFYVECPE